MAMNKVKINSDVELKDRLVAINRVTKVTKGLLLSVTATVSLAGVLARPVKSPQPSPRVQRQPRRIL